MIDRTRWFPSATGDRRSARADGEAHRLRRELRDRCAALGLKWLLTMSSRGLGGWACAAAVWLASGGAGQTADHLQFTTSDGVRLSYLEAGREHGRTVVFVPGWTMPAWIFEAQIEALDDRYHVVALDPRGQGESEVPAFGYAAERRGRDVAELIAAACSEEVGHRVVVVG